MKQYEYTAAYMIEAEAKNINAVTNMMNAYGENGWHFTGMATKGQNGTFYMFARVKAVVP